MFGGFPFDFWVSAAAYFFDDFLSGDGVSSLLGVLVVLGRSLGYASLDTFLSGDGAYSTCFGDLNVWWFFLSGVSVSACWFLLIRLSSRGSEVASLVI